MSAAQYNALSTTANRRPHVGGYVPSRKPVGISTDPFPMTSVPMTGHPNSSTGFPVFSTSAAFHMRRNTEANTPYGDNYQYSTVDSVYPQDDVHDHAMITTSSYPYSTPSQTHAPGAFDDYRTGQQTLPQPSLQAGHVAPHRYQESPGYIIPIYENLKPTPWVSDSTYILQSSDTFETDLSNKKTNKKNKKLHNNLDVNFVHHHWFHKINTYKMPTFIYDQSKKYFHMDAVRRPYEGPDDDRYIDSSSWRIEKLTVQATPEIYDDLVPGTASWRRTEVRKYGSTALRLAYWVYRRVPEDYHDWTHGNWWTLIWRWALASIGLIVLTVFSSQGGKLVNGGDYNAFNYSYRGFSKVCRNESEAENGKNRNILHSDGTAASPELNENRLIRPTHLCILINPDDSVCHGAEVVKDEEWNDRCRKQNNTNQEDLPYLFVAYTQLHFPHDDSHALEELHLIAEKAARQLRLPAYWIGCTCMPREENMRDDQYVAQLQEDVYRINDVIRAASSMIIVLGSSNGQHINYLLQEWGRRMWTFPEALLSPKTSGLNASKIGIYLRDYQPDRPYAQLTKYDLAVKAWDDKDGARQLVDHYEGSLTLSRLELSSIALQCLKTRQTDKWLEGDIAYALMGLLRRRPKVDGTDSTFQALARLSLANDSDMLLERLVCMLSPDENGSDWLSLKDAWKINIWDVQPSCQVAAVGFDDTIVLDGCLGAAIKWDSFERVWTTQHFSLMRRLVSYLFQYWAIQLFLLIGISSVKFNKGTGAFFIILGLIFAFATPNLVMVLYGGKYWGNQAWLFGFEGYMDIEEIECKIFGHHKDRLRWSPSGSVISTHAKHLFGSAGQYEECVGLDPTNDPNVQNFVDKKNNTLLGEQKIFTIVDTITMTVTMFKAARPPVVALMCGSEGGMQRAVMCSYDWKTKTCFRETVLRMETPVTEKMRKVGRVKFGFKRPAPYIG